MENILSAGRRYRTCGEARGKSREREKARGVAPRVAEGTGFAHRSLHKCASLGGAWSGEGDLGKLMQFVGGIVV